MTTFYRDDVCAEMNCEVVINGDVITVSYDEDDMTGHKVVYRGVTVGPDRWKLECPAAKGYATLSRSGRDHNCLEGSWYERGAAGMWQVDIDEE
jgi:hypothetical protein